MIEVYLTRRVRKEKGSYDCYADIMLPDKPIEKKVLTLDDLVEYSRAGATITNNHVLHPQTIKDIHKQAKNKNIAS